MLQNIQAFGMNTPDVQGSHFSLGSACRCVQVCVRLLNTISPHTLRPLGTRCRHMAPKGSVHGQSDPKYYRREWQQLNPMSNTKPLHPPKREENPWVWTQFKMCFCSSETVLFWSVIGFFTQYTCLVLKETVSVLNPARFTDLSGFSI